MSLELSQKKKNELPGWKWSYGSSILAVLAVVAGIHLSLQWRQSSLPIGIIWIEIVIAAALIVFLFISMIRKKTSTMWWEVLLVLAAFIGVWIAMLAAMPLGMALLGAGAITIGAFFWPRAWISALFFITGCAGVGLIFALQFPMEVMFLCGLAVVIYDLLRSKQVHMATLFSEAWMAGIAPGLLIPSDARDWSKRIMDVWKPGRGQIVSLLPFMMLAGMGFHLVAYNPWLLLLFAVAIFSTGVLAGQTPQGYLRTWVYLAAGMASYFIYGMIRVLV